MNNGLTVKEIINICQASLLYGSDDVLCTHFLKDTREITKGDTYIGITGAKFDGSAFYLDAFEKGANCVILENDYVKNNEIKNVNKPIIVVKNSILALKQLAEHIRNKSKAKFIGVTGSVGKTSTRDMIYSVLKEEYKTLKTEGNYNNNIGLPLTILRLQDHQAAVIEMGMNHLKEIDYLSNITKPHISVITNVGTAHIGELGSRENILKAKLEIKNGMDDDGILIINNDNDLLHEYYLKNNKNIITIGINENSDFMAKDINLTENSSTFKITYKDQEYKIYCPIPGEVFIYNSLISFAVGALLNIDSRKIIEGIKNADLTKNRLEIIKREEYTIINDAYNASVDSMKSSLSILSKRNEKEKIAVLGDMLELGKFSKNLHEEVGEAVVKNNIDYLITVGENSKYIAAKAIELKMKKDKVKSFNTNQEVIEYLKQNLKKDSVILFKASNGMKLKEIIEKMI